MTADPRADELRRGAVERDMRCAVFDALVSAPKVPYTDAGIDIVKREVIAQLDAYRERTGREYGDVVMEHVGVDTFVRFSVRMTFALWLDILEETRRSFRPIDLTARLAYDDDPAFGDWSRLEHVRAVLGRETTRCGFLDPRRRLPGCDRRDTIMRSRAFGRTALAALVAARGAP